MVRVKLSFDLQTKSYKWELKDNNHHAVIEIESIKGTIYLTNYPYDERKNIPSHIKLTMALSGLMAQGDKRILKDETVLKYPLTPFIWCQAESSSVTKCTDIARCYSPITCKWYENWTKDLYHFHQLLTAIHTDILNYALKSQQMDQQIQAYQQDRQSIISTFSEIENTIKPIGNEDKKQKSDQQ